MSRTLAYFLPALLLLGESLYSLPSNSWEVDKVKSEDKGGEDFNSWEVDKVNAEAKGGEATQCVDCNASGTVRNLVEVIGDSGTGIKMEERMKEYATIETPFCDSDAVGAILLQYDEINSNTNDMASTSDGETSFPNVEKRSKQFPCPTEEHIAPCVCQVDEQVELVMDCSNVTSSEELAQAFQSEFPVLDLSSFILSHNSKVIFLDDLFNGVSFKNILISDVVNLEVITDYCFIDSVETLALLFIEPSKLHRITFPFITLGEYRQLMELHLGYAQGLTSIPIIISDYLKKISFDSSAIGSITNDTFSRAPMLEEINLNGNKLSLLSSGAFLLRPALTDINLQYNNMTAIEPGAFIADPEGSTVLKLTIQLSSNALTSLEANTFLLTDRPTSIELYNNSLTTVEAGAFVMPSTTGEFVLYIDLRNNLISTLAEGVWGAVFPSLGALAVEGNPLSCDCSLSWLVLEESYLSKLDAGAACENGTLLLDLGQDHFESCYFSGVAN